MKKENTISRIQNIFKSKYCVLLLYLINLIILFFSACIEATEQFCRNIGLHVDPVVQVLFL